ncbi:MAG: ribosomal protein L7/L12 [Bacteroidaceae bacterium]|nr:ribosomal protein L7/L12 [Bacteroidaceae bacterium]
MIKHRLFILVALICMLQCANDLFAQVTVSVTPRQNPLPAQGAVYMTDPGRYFNVSLTNTSASELIPVRLEARIEGPIEGGFDILPDNGSYMAISAQRTMPVYIPLSPGHTRVLTQTDLYNMFRQYDAGTEMFGGGELYDVLQGGSGNGIFGILPEGHYGLKITAKTNYTEYNDAGDVLGEAVCFFDICYNASAPSFNNIKYINGDISAEADLINQDGYNTAYFPTANPRFSWNEPAFNNTRLSITRQFLYDFRIYQLAINQEPSDAILYNGNIAFEQLGLMTPYCVVPYNVVARLKRYANVKYVAQVTARPLVTDVSNPNYTILSNEGKSEIVVLLMEDDALGKGEDMDIVVDNSTREYPINVAISPKYTELPAAMYSYFETPGKLFNVTLENTSGENIPVCMLLQYFKGNWGVTAATARQHTNKYIEIPAGEKINLSEEQINELAGSYDFDTDVIAFKAKTGFIMGKPTSEYFSEKIDTAFLRVCRYTGGKPVLRETIIGKGRAEFQTNPNVLDGEMFNISFEPKMPILPADGKYYFTKPSRIFKLKIKSLAPNAIRVFPALQIGESTGVGDEKDIYNGSYFSDVKRMADNYLTFNPGETKTFTDEEFDRFFGGFMEIKSVVDGEDGLITDFSTIKFEEQVYSNLMLLDYDRLSMLDLKKESASSAMLMQYEQSHQASSEVKLGDVDIMIEPVKDFPVNGDVYIEDPGRIFNIVLTNLTDKDLKLIPGITYENRIIDEETYSYAAAKFFNEKPEFVLRAKEKKVLDRNFLKQFCGDETAVRHIFSTDENEFDFTDFDEIITTEDANHMKFTLVNADSVRAIPKGSENRSERLTVSTMQHDFWANPDYILYDIDIEIKPKMNPMPYNTRAYFTKPEQLFEVWLSNASDEDLDIIPLIKYNFNGDYDVTYLSGSYNDPNIPIITIEAGTKKQMKDEYVNKFFAGKKFYKMVEQESGHPERTEYNIYNADKDIIIDPELFSNVEFVALSPKYLDALGTGAALVDFYLGTGNLGFQVSSTVRLDDVSVLVKPKMQPLPANADLYFNSPGTLFDIELKNNTLHEYKVIPNIMYLFDEFGSYYGSVYDDKRLEKFITLAPGEIKQITASDLNALCGSPDTIKCFEARLDGFVEKAIPDINEILNLEAFNQIEVIAYCVDSLKSLPKEMEDRKTRAMLGGGKSDFIAKNIKFEEVVVTIVPKAGADFQPEPDKYFEKPGDLFEVTLLNVTNEEQKVNLRLTYNYQYFIDKPDSVITLKPEEKLKLSANRLNNICGYDMYSYGAPLFECDSLGNVKKEKPDATDIEIPKGDNTVTALVWKKLIEDELKPEEFKVDSVSVCDTIFQPALRDVWIGEYRLTLTDFEKISGKDPQQKEMGNDCFKGKGYVHTTVMNIPVRLAVEYDSIYIDNELQRVVKNNVRTITEESAHVPLDLFKEEFVKELEKTDKEGAEAKVDQFLKESNVGAFYTYVIGNAMQTIGKIDSAAVVKLPLGLTVPLDKELECPATIQLAKMEFTPVDANLDLIGEFVLPESPDPENLAYSDILIFAARKLSTSPDEFLPKSGSLGLVKDFRLEDPSSDFIFTFKAPTNQDYSKATDGCFIAWENGGFKELCASISMNIPSSVIVKDNGKDAIDENVHPEVTLTAFIADAEDWFATVKMDPFQITSAPGYTFSAVGDSVGIVFDRSKRRTPAGIKFPANYDYDKDGLGLTADPGTNEQAYNEWQGFYFEELSCKLPHFVELDDKNDSRVKIAVNGIIYDESGFSMGVEVDSLLNRGTPKVGGWRITIDKIFMHVKQSHFGDAGFNGRIEVPLLYKKGTKDKAQIGYKAAVTSVDHGAKKGLAVNFGMQQIEDSISLDFMLANVNFYKDSTYFNIVYCDTLPEEKQTLVELCLDGDVEITCTESIDFKLPAIPFENMRIANFEKDELDKKKDKKSDKKTENKSLKDPNGDTDFHTGRWALAGDPGEDEGSFWGGMPIVLEKISMEVGDGAEKLGFYIEGGIVVMGNKKFGLGCTAGLTIWSKIDWEEMALSYDRVEFNTMHVEGQFAGMVSVVGDLTVAEEEEKSGFDAELEIKVKGLFEMDVAGGYYKIQKGDEEFKLDDADEKNDKYYHAGFFVADAKLPPVPIGPVSLKGISGGFFINYSVPMSAVEGTDDFVTTLKENLKPKYKSYGGMFGVDLVVGEETLIKGNATMLLMIDIQKDGVRCPGLLFQGNVAALCAPDSDEGLINSKITILYEDTTTPDLTDEEMQTMSKADIAANLEKKKDEHKLFRLSITVDADMAGVYKQFTGEELQIKNPMVGLEEFDQKNADSENQGEQNNTASSSGAAESKGYIKAGASASISLELEVRNYPAQDKTFWHLYVGEPDESKRCRITFIDFEFGRKSPVGLWAKLYANAYLCLGNELPGDGQLPPLPDKVSEALGMKGADGKVDNSLKGKIAAAREQTMKGGPAGGINGGIMLGAAIGAEIGCNAVFCYADVEGMLGFDLILKQYKEGIKCTDGRRAGGKNGFYATGQFYAMLKGELGLMINLWIFEGKVPLVDMTLGALLQGGFPNPTWVYGRLRAKGSVLGGLIKFSSTIEMKAGKICVPEMGNPLDDIKVFGDINPGDEDIEIGWADKSLVSCYGKSTFTTNMKIGKVLTLVDEGETMERAGMDGDGNNVLRKYVFYLDKQFELCKYDESDNTNDNRTKITTYVTHINPTYDQENYEIQLGALQPRTLYRIKLRGTCKEIVDGDEVNPIYKDTITGKKVNRPYEDKRYVYFRTDNLSDDINKEVANYLPNLTPFTQTLDEVTQPSFMEMHERPDYWLNPDHEFVASIKVYDSKTNTYVFPDARDGLRKGQITKYDNLQVVEIVEQGIDESNNNFKFATVTLQNPVPREFFKTSDKVRFEIRRINRAQLDSYMDMVEESYKNILALTKEDMAEYESQLDAMDAAIAEGDKKAGDKNTNQAIRDLYNYYKEMSDLYGENEAEQRMKEYKEELKANTSAFAEVVYTQDYKYNGQASFLDYVTKSDNWSYSGSDANDTNTSTVYCQMVDIVTKEEAAMVSGYDPNAVYGFRTTENRSNNPYFALNYWNSTAAVWRAPKYDFCSRPFDECNFSGSTSLSYNLTYPYLRNGIAEGSKYSDTQYERGLNPKFAVDWFKYNDMTTYTRNASGKKKIFKIVWYAIYNDAYLAENLESKLKLYYNIDLKYGIEKNKKKDIKNLVDRYADNGSMMQVYSNFVSDGGYSAGSRSWVQIPSWQIALMYAADHTDKYGLKASNSRSATSSYKYFTGQWSTFKADNYLNRIKELKVRIRFSDGYNIAEASGKGRVEPTKFGVRPSTSAKRTAIISCNINGKGVNGITDNNISINREEYVTIGDPVMLEYLLNNYDKNDDGRLHIDEMAAITTLKLDFSTIKGKVTRPNQPVPGIVSLDALKLMPNLKKLELLNNMNGDMSNSAYNKFHTLNKTLRLDGNPKLQELTLEKWYVDSLDLRYNTELRKLNIDMRSMYNRTPPKVNTVRNSEGVSYLDVSKCTKLWDLRVIGCFIEKLDLSNIATLEVLDLRMNCLSHLDISASYKLSENFVKAGFQTYKTAKGRAISSYIKYLDVKTFGLSNSSADYMNQSSVNYKARFTKEATRDKGVGTLDSNLYSYMYDEAMKAKKTVFEWASAQTTLRVPGLKIKSLKNLDAWMPKLTLIDVSDNELTELDLTGFAELKQVYANNNRLADIKVRGDNNKIYWLEVSNNSLSSLPIDAMPKLSHLKCANNSIDIIYPNVNTELNYLDCSNNYLTELVLDKMTNITTLKCSYNKLTNGNFKIPANASLHTFEAAGALGDIDEVDLSSSTNIRIVNVANNPSLKRLKLAATTSRLEELVANNCALTKIYNGGNNFSLFNYDSQYKPKSTMAWLKEVNVANNPGMSLTVVYNYANYQRLRAIDVTGCNILAVYLHGTNINYLTRLCAGVPQRASGYKVEIKVFSNNWYKKWDEWKDYPENRHTTYMRLYSTSYPYKYLGSYDPSCPTRVETITEDDKKLRAAMGETFYNHMKEKLRPDSLGYRALHVENVKDLTELQCANMQIVDLDGILKYMPKAKVVNAMGNEMKTVILKNLDGVDKLNLSNNAALDSLSFNYQYSKLDELNLSHSYVNEYGLVEALNIARNKKLIVDGDIGPTVLEVAKYKYRCNIKEMSLVSKGRNYVLYNLVADKLTVGGKSLKFFMGSTGSYTAYSRIEHLYLADSAEPIELIFTSADMALLWLNKWINDNPNRKFTMKIETGDVSINNSVNSLLSIVNNVTKNGISRLDDNVRQMANNYVLKYAWEEKVPKGELFRDVLDDYDLHEKRSNDDVKMRDAMGSKLYLLLKKQYAPAREYLHVEDVKKVTTLDCKDCGVVNLTNVLKYMPSLTTVKASGNRLRSVTLGENGRLTSVDLSGSTVALDTLKFKNTVLTLDLSKNTINSRVLDAAIINTVNTLTINGAVGINMGVNTSTTCVKTFTTDNNTLRLYKAKFQGLNFSGKYLYFYRDMSEISVSNLKLNAKTQYELNFSTADNALKFIAEWSENNIQTSGNAPKFNMTVGSNSNTRTLLSSYNTLAKAGNGFLTANKKKAVEAIITAVNRGYVTKGSGYDRMITYLNSIGLTDIQTAEDLELKNALGSMMYNHYKNKYASTKKYLHTTDVKGITTLDAERTELVNLTTVLKYMTNVTTIYAGYNDIANIDVSAHNRVIKTLDLSNNTKLSTLKLKKSGVQNIDLSYSRISSDILKTALNNCSGTVTVNGNYGNQLLTLSNVTAGRLDMRSTNRILQLSSCTLSKLTFGGQKLIFEGDLSKCKISDFVINRPSGSVTVQFHSADAALMWVEYWYKNTPTTSFTIELIGSNSSNSTSIKARLVSINNTLRRGGKINETTRTQLYDVIKLAVSSYGLKQGSMYGNYVKVIGQSGDKTVTIQSISSKIGVIKALQDMFGLSLTEAKSKYVDVLPSVVGKFSSSEAAEIKKKLEDAGAVVTVQ